MRYAPTVVSHFICKVSNFRTPYSQIDYSEKAFHDFMQFLANLACGCFVHDPNRLFMLLTT